MRRLQVRKALEEQYKYEQVAGTRRPRGDAVHDQRFYVGRALHKKLEAEDVVAWEIPQHLGDAVFIGTSRSLGMARRRGHWQVRARRPRQWQRPFSTGGPGGNMARA